MSSPLCAADRRPPSAPPSSGSAASRLAPLCLDGGEGVEAGCVVAGQPARLVIDDVGQRRDFGGRRPDLVDLLLVLHHREAHAGMVEHIGHLVGDRVGIDRHGNRAERLRRREGPVEARPVGADDGDPVALREPERLQADGQAADLLELLAPRSSSARCRNPCGAWRGGRPASRRCAAGISGTCSSRRPDAVASMLLLLPAPRGPRLLRP